MKQISDEVFAKIDTALRNAASGFPCPLYEDAVAALTAAKQAQPDGINDVYLKGYAAGKQAQPERAPIVWPKEKDVGRYGDMSPSAHLRVGLDTDNDAYVSVWDENGGGTIEFCNPSSGGGKSSRTRMALVALMVAMEADNAERPELDWWARRMGIKQGGPT